MITIKETSRDFDKVETYLMTQSNNMTALKDIDDNTVIDVDGFLIFEDEKKDGKKTEVLSIITPDKVVYSGQSATFRESLKTIHGIMDGEPYKIFKLSGKTKAGRDYIDCSLFIG